jgi:hypothetical protein
VTIWPRDNLTRDSDTRRGPREISRGQPIPGATLSI